MRSYNIPRNVAQKIISDTTQIFNSQAITFLDDHIISLLRELHSDQGNIKLVETMFDTLKKLFSTL